MATPAAHAMIATANPLATDAGYAILQQGGSAIDAAIAAQLVLGLAEPQSSGIGGGALLVFYDGNRVVTFDGREIAPAAVTPERFLDASGTPLSFQEAAVGGHSVGVPGALKVLDLAHRRYGTLPWATLFQPAIDLARAGFPLSPRLHWRLAAEHHLGSTEPARSYFYQADGTPKAVGTLLHNPDYARVLEIIATQGAEAFYRGPLVEDMVQAVRQHPTRPGDLCAADFAAYTARQREPLQRPYRGYTVYGMPPPSSGGIATLQMLGMLERFPLSQYAPLSVESVHLFTEAGRLAYADRARYAADSDFVAVPVDGLLDTAYLATRSQQISLAQTLGVAPAGEPRGASDPPGGDDRALELPSTSHIAVVDAQGRALAMTTSIEAPFGSRIMVHGSMLNNQLTDFSFVPTVQGHPVANRIAPHKRPRSAMAPTLVFDAQGRFTLALGSPGGSSIINYVAQTLVALLDWRLDPQQAVSLPAYGSRNGPTELEAGSALEALVPLLTARGHQVTLVQATSGLSVIQRTARGYIGGVDPRREGTVKGL
ncbi:MAG: gamma-glutamyltransferase [Candidatus Tectomicrobia bacterium]|uniref:Glutathione hydrolase proenzyme n=1 Tax=Tectimicrobiota bacterium TaxID=2528274 RepID=A0A937W4P2_UNCTE|nr:gamma-glutamyltransferase [Candidatus Tectomicrobia bacterium]